MAQLNSFRDLRVYQELRRLHLAVHEESLRFPKFELYELGAQVRRSSNAAPAIVAEGWGSRHTNIYIEAVDRAKGEVRETQHHLDMAHAKGYIDASRWAELDTAYEICGKMLERLHDSLSEWRNTTRTGSTVRESVGPYCTHPDEGESLVAITASVMAGFAPTHLPPATSLLPPPTSHLPPAPPATCHP